MPKALWIVAVFVAAGYCTAATAQDRNCQISGNYAVGFDGCYHRTPAGVLAGCGARYKDCGHASGQSHQDAQNIPYVLATPSQVTAALVCDIAAAANKKGQQVDLKKALISANLTFSLVHQTSAGASLTVGAIPVFTGASFAPSLSLSSIKGVTTVGRTDINVDPMQLELCDHSSTNNWLTSEVVTQSLPNGVSVAEITESIQYILNRQGSAGLKLNIVPIAIGPQVSDHFDKAQQICLLFDFSKKAGSQPDRAKCPSGPSGGGSSDGK